MAVFTKAIKINLNMGGNTLSNVVIGSSDSAPSSFVKNAGYIYFDTTKNKFGVCTGFAGEGQDRHPTWAYMETVAAVESKLESMRDSLTIAKHSETATGIDISITAENSTQTSTLYLDGLMTAVAAVNTKPNPAHDTDTSAPATLSGRFLQVTKTGNNGVADQVSYVDLPDEVTSGALDETAAAEKIALTLSDGSTVNIDLTSLYTKLNQQALNVEQTNSVTLTKTGGTSGTATTISASVNVSDKAGNAISTLAAQAGEGGHTAGLYVEKTTTIAASDSASDNKLATESAVRAAVDAVESQEMHRLTNKWFDAQGTGNKLSNVDANNFDSDAMALTEAEAALSDKSSVQFTSLAKVNALITAAQTEAVRYRGAWTITIGGTVTAETTGGDITLGQSVDLVKFKAKAAPTAESTYVFTYGADNAWHLGESEDASDLAEYGVSYTGTPAENDTITLTYATTPAATSDMSGITLPVKKGDFFLVNGTGPVTIDGVEFNPGDHIIANTNIPESGTATVGKFDKVDNTESADLVRKDASQVLTNKGIDADNNNISNLEVDNFKSGVIKTTVRAASSASDDAIPSELAVRTAINTATPHVDNATLEAYTATQGDDFQTLRVKDGGIGINHMASAALELGTGSGGESQANAKLPSKTKVEEMIVAERDATATLKKKTLDLDSTSADKNIIQNAELGIFAGGVVVTTVGATGSDDAIPTEQAVREAIDTLDTNGIHSYRYKNEADSFVVDDENNVQSATWTLTAPAGANHNLLHATLIEATTAGGNSGREVDCDIQYNTESGTVVFGINCDSKPVASTYIAVILG